MKIAVLGWDSLIWKPAYSRPARGPLKRAIFGPRTSNLSELQLADDRWHWNGPLLPIEFARIQEDPQGCQWLRPVVRRDARRVPTLWARSAFVDFSIASRNLATVGSIGENQIGYVKAGIAALSERSQLNAITQAQLDPTNDQTDTDQLLRTIDAWRKEQGFDAVIWTDAPSNFEQMRHDEAGHSVPLDTESAVLYLQELIHADLASVAEENFRRAPVQIGTPVRSEAARVLQWEPLPEYTITDADDLGIKEWTECRATIDRLDKILVDLRKVGFSFITTLLAAGAILSFLGVQTSQNGSVPPAPTRAAPFVAIMFLVVALFSVDSYYEVLLSGAVERALDLETRTDPPMRVTKYISINAALSGATWITLGLYLFLLVIGTGLGTLGTITGSTTRGNPPASYVTFEWNPLAYGFIGFGLILATFMIVYWSLIGVTTGVHTQKAGRPWRPGEGPLAKIGSP